MRRMDRAEMGCYMRDLSKAVDWRNANIDLNRLHATSIRVYRFAVFTSAPSRDEWPGDTTPGGTS